MNFDKTTNTYSLSCPHCGGMIVIHKKYIKCAIFRHAIYKHNGKQINPHSSKEVCEKLLKANKIYGCGKPFKFDGKTLSVCDYI